MSCMTTDGISMVLRPQLKRLRDQVDGEIENITVGFKNLHDCIVTGEMKTQKQYRANKVEGVSISCSQALRSEGS